jgi:hypothetical protein
MSKSVESQHQTLLFKACSYNAILKEYLFHIPNGGYRNPQEAASLRRQGVKSGIPDLCLAYPSKSSHGLYIELKRPIIKGENKPVVTVEQRMWIEKLNKVGYKAVICYGWPHAWDVLIEYLEDI